MNLRLCYLKNWGFLNLNAPNGFALLVGWQSIQTIQLPPQVREQKTNLPYSPYKFHWT